MSKQDDWWRTQATDDDICDANLSVEDFIPLIIPHIEPVIPEANASILELGCGYGRLTVEVKKHFPDAFVSGTDINTTFLSRAEEHSGYRADKGNPTKYPFYYERDNLNGIPKQNAIYSVAVFQHLPNNQKRDYIRQVSKGLRKGGIFRFQYVEGDADTFLTHDAHFKDVSEWCEDAGIEIASVDYDLIKPRWTWITGVKK